MKLTIKVKDLRPGDYVPAAKATVADVQSLGSVVIVDFTDKTATAPMPGHAPVEIERK